MELHRNQSSRDKIYAVKNSMHKTKEEIDQINKYLTRYEQRLKSSLSDSFYGFAPLVPIKKTIYCSMMAKDIESIMRKKRALIEMNTFD